MIRTVNRPRAEFVDAKGVHSEINTLLRSVVKENEKKYVTFVRMDTGESLSAQETHLANAC